MSRQLVNPNISTTQQMQSNHNNMYVEQAQSQSKTKRKKRRLFGKDGFMLLLIGILSISVIGLGVMVFQLSTEKDALSASQELSLDESEVERIKEGVSSLMYVDAEEEPTIATVIDPEKLKESNAVFYENAQQGDRLIVYSDKAILFRESENKIVNVAPVIRTDDAQGATDDAQPAQVAGEETEQQSTEESTETTQEVAQ